VTHCLYVTPYKLLLIYIFILMTMYYERFPYKEEVTGSNPVAPTRVFQKSTYRFTIYGIIIE